MRVAVIGPTFPYRGGIAHYTSELTNTLSRKGHEVSLISFRRQYPAWLYPGQSDQDPSRQVLGARAQFLLDPLNPLTWYQTARAICHNRPDLVILQWWAPFWGPAFAALGYLLRRAGTPVLYLVHNVFPHEPRTGDELLTRLALRWGQAYLTWTRGDYERLTHLFPDAPIAHCQLPVCPLPTNPLPSSQEARARLNIKVDVPVILSFGFVRPYKGTRTLLEAVALLKQQNHPVFLVVAGECWEDSATYTQYIAHLGIEDWVRWDDHYIPNEEVGVYFAAADVFAAPYAECAPSAALTLAQRFGVPVVASRGLIDTVTPANPTLRLLDTVDAVSLGQAISQLAFGLAGPKKTPIDPQPSWDALACQIERLALALRGY